MPPPSGGTGAFPVLGENPNKSNGTYLVIQCKSEDENLAKASPILVEKTVKATCGEVQSIKKTSDGKILVLTKSEKQAKVMMKLEKMGNYEVSVVEHRSLNTCRVVISDRELLYEEDSEIEKVLKPQGVTKVERIMRKRDAELQKTSSFIVHVKASVPPSNFKIGYLSVVARPYYPRPLRCFNCLQFGHLGRECKREKTCRKCSQVYHSESCEEEEKCINCKGKHNALSNECEKYQEQVKITKLKVDKRISYWEAKKLIEAEQKKSYAEQVKQATAEVYEKAALQRENEFKEMIKAYENKIKSLEMEVQKINENYQKALNRMTEERTARKRAEKEYDDLSKWIQSTERKKTQAQNIESGTKHGRQSSDYQTSPLRKKSCKKMDTQSLVIESDDSIIEED